MLTALELTVLLWAGACALALAGLWLALAADRSRLALAFVLALSAVHLAGLQLLGAEGLARVVADSGGPAFLADVGAPR